MENKAEKDREQTQGYAQTCISNGYGSFHLKSLLPSVFEPGALFISLESSSLEASSPKVDSYLPLSEGFSISSTSMGSSTILENSN